MAEGNSVFDAVIRAVDLASGPIGTIAARFKGLAPVVDAVTPHAKGFGAVFRAAFGEVEHGAEHAAHGMHEAAAAAGNAGRAIRKAGEEAAHAGPQIAHAAHPHAYGMLAAHLSIVRGHFGEIGATVRETGGQIGELLPALGVLGAAAGVAGLFEMVEHASEAFSELNKQAAGAGMSVAAFQNLSTVGKMADVSAETMTTAMFRLHKVIANVLSGKDKDAAGLFRHLGISLRDAGGHTRAIAELLPELADAFAHTSDESMQARMAMALFGKAGKEMLPLLTLGKEELEDLGKEADKLNFTPDEKSRKGLESYHRSLVGMNVAAHGFMLEISTRLAPVLEPVVRMATDWMLANRDWISAGIAEHVGDLARWVEHINFKEVIEKTSEWGKKAYELISDFGGLKVVLEGIVLIKAVGWAAPFVRGLLDISLALRAVIAGAQALEAAVGATAFGRLLAAITPAAVGRIARVGGPAGAFLYTLLDPTPTQSEEFERAGLDQWRKEHGIPLTHAGRGETVLPANTPVGPRGPQLPRAPSVLWKGARKVVPGTTFLVPQHDAPVSQPEQPWAPAGQPYTRGWRVPKPLPPTLFELPSLYIPGGAAAPGLAGPREGRVKTEITIRGAPPGTTVRSSASGIADHPDVDVGHAGALETY